MVTPAVPASATPPGRQRSLAGRLIRWLLVLVVSVLVAAGAAFYEVQRRITSPYKGFTDAEVLVELPPGSSVNTIGRALARAGIVRDATTFRIAVWKLGAGRALKAGEYAFRDPASPEQVVARLVRGDVAMRAITFPEGLTLREMAALYESKGFGEATVFRRRRAGRLARRRPRSGSARPGGLPVPGDVLAAETSDRR